jgi:hypothetical protein
MDTVVTPYLKKLESIEKELPNIARQILTDNSSEIVLLVKGQLSHGLNSNGKPLKWSDGTGSGTGFYAKSTQSFYDRDNYGGNFRQVPKTHKHPYNFSWSGETLDMLEMGVIKDSFFEVTTAAYKKNLLEEIYGEIFDLTEEHNLYVNMEILLPGLEKYILDSLFSI